jgi:pyridinium-3,5-bisthiocarboxylic acid mononucleotide nickel chelatase
VSRYLLTNELGTSEAGLLTRVAWWNCFSGIAGDMALASLLDAGADLVTVIAGLEKIPVAGWHLEATRTLRGGLAATQLRVDVDPAEEQLERTWASIRSLIDQADGLPERVRRRAQTVFARLAEAEGRLHGVPVDEVHFHEVGGLDAIVDVVGTCLALESLDVTSVCSSPVALGNGTVKTAHGLLPVPTPAVIELLKDVPVYGSAPTVELATPTGAALLAGLADSFGPLPPVMVKASGYGAGGREFEGAPNVLQVVVGELQVGARRGPGWAQELVVVEANVDDVTGEVLGHTIEALMGAGALDAWVVPVVGKKGRPGHVVSFLAEPAKIATLAGVLVTETGTLGYREHHVTRAALDREIVEVEVGGVAVRVKAGPHRVKAEYEDCARAATMLGLPTAEVARLAEQAARPSVPPAR